MHASKWISLLVGLAIASTLGLIVCSERYNMTSDSCTSLAEAYQQAHRFSDVAHPLNYQLVSVTQVGSLCYSILQWSDYELAEEDHYYALELVALDTQDTLVATDWFRRCDAGLTPDCGGLHPNNENSVLVEGKRTDPAKFFTTVGRLFTTGER